ncbi:TPA: hypothetical protein N0F65_008689 [Lagenidium giganteum]|uniref:TATA-binding protein interacting (TIP20) domain-containing protein n=1 Tax=Lagenidium giganteum TaxID=4803 RepID=A0AAV2Z984_9STRA|nr:TPA: hypothetical protein N0F65_008689 [Lagenidium giganteum]
MQGKMLANTEKITLLLDKTTDFDKDERYMATSDLCNELNKNVELGQYLEPKVCAAILKQLDDKSNDVQSIAVKWSFVWISLGILVTKVQEAQVQDICDKLCGLILTGKPELRDIYSIGLKTILADVTQKTGSSIATSVCARLLPGLQRDTDQAVKSESLDILTDLLRRFGHDISTEHQKLMDILIEQLGDASPLVRKRATACVGSLGVMASDTLVTRLVEHLIRAIQAPSQNLDVRTLIQTIGTLSRTAGHRLGQHLDAIIPILVKFCGDPEDESLQNESSNELRENCFQAFESFITRCHNEITPHLNVILPLTMEFIKYDPNYNYGDSADEDEPMDEDEEEYSEEDEGDYSDDDDTSWKVRRASLRVLSAIIATRAELLEQLYIDCAQPLISRFKEREENVRIDVFNVFAELLLVTRQSIPATGAPTQASINSVAQLHERVRAIIQGANKQLGPKVAISSRCAVIAMLSELAAVEKGQLGAYIDLLMPQIIRALEDKHSDLKLDTLIFVRLLVDTHDVEPFVKHSESLVRVATNCARGDWYKTVAKALGLIESLAPLLRADTDAIARKKHALALFDAVLPSLKANDIDQEIKESAISSMGQLVSALGDDLNDRVSEVYPLFMERLNNEITRVHSMKALAAIARSPLNLIMTPILSECCQSLAQLLRQQSRTLKQAALDALTDIVIHKGKEIPENLLSDVVLEAAVLVVDSDLQLCKLAISLVSHILEVCPGVASQDSLLQRVLPNALELCRSAMLQGPTLDALKGFLAQLTRLNAPQSDFNHLFNSLTSIPADLPKHSLLNSARCIAAICSATANDNRQMAFSKFVSEISTPTSEKNKVLALYCLGEFGREMDLTSFPDVKPIILSCFSATEEEVKSAAAYALGSICVGNVANYLETIIQKLEQGEETNSYLLLSSLREVIIDHATSEKRGFSPHVDRVIPVLRKLSEREEEGVRNIVAECVGKLAVTDGSRVVPTVLELCGSSSARARWTAATSVKHASTTTSKDLSSLEQLFSQIDPFLKTLEDEDLHVRRAALLALNTAAHHHPHMLPFVKERVFGLLLKAMEIKLERVVDLGPFKHKVDDGLPLRKAAYSCVETMIETMPQQLDIAAFLPYLQLGLKDQDDIQMLCHQILVKICEVKPGSVVGALDLILEPLEKTINKKVKEDQVGTEVERVKDLIRSALRAVEAIHAVRDADSHPKFHALYESIKKTKSLATLLESTRSESSS